MTAGLQPFLSDAVVALRAPTQVWSRPDGELGSGAIDGVFARTNIPDRQERVDRDDILKPEEIASNYVWLHKQQRSAWTHELDLRPWSESW